jgi:stage V sporulation protein G
VEITEVRVKLVSPGSDKLRAFCSITIDNSFVIRDLKIIEGAKGPFVAMPSRKLMTRCPRCGGKNHHRAAYCNGCGIRLPEERGRQSLAARARLHADIAHPINPQCRDLIQRFVLAAFEDELSRSREPGYRPAVLDDFDDDYIHEEADGGKEDVRGRPAATPALESSAWTETHPRAEEAAEPPYRRGAGDLEKGLRERAMPAQERYRAPEGRSQGPGRERPAIRPIREVRSARERRGSRESEREERPPLPGGREPWRAGEEPQAGRGRPAERGEMPGTDRFGFLRPEAPRDPLRQERRLPEEVESEPDDNFGAGLFS